MFITLYTSVLLFWRKLPSHCLFSYWIFISFFKFRSKHRCESQLCNNTKWSWFLLDCTHWQVLRIQCFQNLTANKDVSNQDRSAVSTLMVYAPDLEVSVLAAILSSYNILFKIQVNFFLFLHSICFVSLLLLAKVM